MTTASPPPIDFAALGRAELADDGGRALDALLLVSADIVDATRQAVAAGFAVMPTGGLTSAIGSFDYKKESVDGFAGIVAIRPKGALTPDIVDATTPIEQLRTHEVAVDRENGLVSAGAGLTFTQINAVLAEQVGPNARVLVDLTSIGSAFVGGVVATGAMGPLRMRPSTTLDAVVLADGGEARVMAGDDLDLVEGLQGWTGMVAAARFRFYDVPPSEFGLVLPVQGSDIDAVAGLLAYLEPWTQVHLPGAGGRLGNGDTVLNGVELVSRDSLEVFVEHAQDPARSKAQGLLQSCEYAGADWLACITGWSENSVDDVLFSLLDPETETIGGVMIEYGVGFSSGAEMDTFRAIREGAPDLARTRARVRPEGRMKPWTTSTDVNVSVPADAGAIAEIMAAYADYRQAVRTLARELAGSGVDIELSAYGHLSPHGIDPHHRVTIFADQGQETALAAARQAVLADKRTLIRDLLHAAERGGGRVTGGEKGAPSLVEIARAAGGEGRMPEDLRRRMGRARAAVSSAPPNFNFRAPDELKCAQP
ncbi:putative FAD linked oxidase domain protein [Magnetospirillum sp. LM-5]|uniref:FAD-binding oxidoreductase n=1 Tax=Magnetospirillum sp. LM-5 TaxID=2681466 RepID=UPI0013835EEB|nr:FAD-binding protein [Magnetospirillum sp. LM-5]CAA7621309.1 putative FAD linked oxidase domain protein [Magnetospirillum sp. LM-5]